MKKIILIILFIATITYSGNSQVYFWNALEKSSMPEPISNNAVVEGWANDTPYVFSFAGIDNSKIWSGISLKSFRYNTYTNIWETIPPLPDTMGKIACGASYVDSIIYIIGGYHVLANQTEISSNKVHRYDPRTNSYLPDGANIPVPIDDHVQAVWNDSLIYVITGWSNTTNVPNVQIYDPGNDQWLTGTSVPNNNNFICFGGSGTIVGNKIYYHGGASNGFNFPGQSNLRIGHINPSNPTQIDWTLHSFSNPEVTYRAVVIEDQIWSTGLYWVGGSSTTYNFDGVAYNGSGGVNPRYDVLTFDTLANTTGNTFYSIFPNWGDTVSMDLRGVANFGGSFFIAGGMNNNQQVTDKVYELLIAATGIDEVGTNPNFKLFPNPASNQLHLEFKDQTHYTIQVLDLLGKEIGIHYTEKLNESIDISGYIKGIYLVKVSSDKGISTQKIIIQ